MIIQKYKYNRKKLNKIYNLEKITININNRKNEEVQNKNHNTNLNTNNKI